MQARKRFVFVFSLVLLSCGNLYATQDQETTYEPRVGQPGKDVVWVPTPQVLVEQMLDLAQVIKQDYVIDLGSGDGRTVITAAKRGARAHGIEYEAEMVKLAIQNALDAGVEDKATFEQADLFEKDLSQADVITMFLLPSINMRLRPHLLELRPGTRIVSNTFTMEEWGADETVTVTEGCTSWCTALLWLVPAKVEGAWETSGEPLALTQEFQIVSGKLGDVAISEGRLRGDRISFKVGNVNYSGLVNGGAMKGTIDTTPPSTWNAMRK